MPITVTCTSCNTKLKIPEGLAGKKVKCPKCAAVTLVPAGLPDAPGITPEPPPPAPRSAAEPAPVRDEDRAGPRPARRRRRRTDDEFDEEPRVRRRETDDLTEVTSMVVPFRNSKALIAYYCGVFGLIPCLGLILGPLALIFGILGLRYRKANPAAHGFGHALAGIILGSVEILGNYGVAIAVVVIGVIGSRH